MEEKNMLRMNNNAGIINGGGSFPPPPPRVGNELAGAMIMRESQRGTW